ncbi:50S ribosomal protein L33 [Bacillus cereus]|nr:50S ribosomal protein L33 [Bacillus cereus]
MLSCDGSKNQNYYTMKDTSSIRRLEIKKFCKTCNQHTSHKETK